MIKKLFSYLKGGGVDVYLPAKKPGKCTSAYAVAKEEKCELSTSGRCSYIYFSVTVFAPLEDYASLEETTARVKASLKGTAFKFFGSEGADSGGDANGYKRILTYRAIKPVYCKQGG